MNKHDYIMALAMNHGVAKVNVSGVEIPVMITNIESDNSPYRGTQTKFECQVVNVDQIKGHDIPRCSGRYPWGSEDDVKYPNGSIPKSILSERAAKAASLTHHFEISRVYFNNPVTVVLWADGTKTIVRCQEGDSYSKETGLALCIAKKALGNKGNFNDIFHKWIPEEEEETFSIPTIHTASDTVTNALARIEEALSPMRKEETTNAEN